MTAQEQITKIESLASFEVIESSFIKDLDSYGMLVKHKATGARIVLMLNNDDNKVFYIGFRTPPTDSTGVAHIIEHSVLCGSDKYPVKDPFIELAKGSLNTFLNAMTYSDKTVYPIASCNNQDFKNLMDVYMDAVLHPNIYKEEKIFKQEGWHYDLESADAELKISGVVYNEMKGAFSSPDDVVEREMLNALFPDTAYGVESGGDPDNIPDLTYENFLDFHSRYYHPSNSYIYIYGDCDMVERLEYLDREYLSKYEALEIDSTIKIQTPWNETKYMTKEYPIAETESGEDQAYLTYSLVVGENNLSQDEYLAFEALDYAICSAPGAPLKKALVEAGIGKEVYSEYENGIMQPYFSIVAKDTNYDKLDEFVRIVEDELNKLAEGGLNHTSLMAALNLFEFKYREADFGSYPRGLMLGLQLLDSWLYDENKPFLHIVANDTFARLKSKVETGYYEALIRDRILNNNHKVVLSVLPKKGLTTIKDNALAEKLAAYKASLTSQEIDELVKATVELAEYQESEDSVEALMTIPLLTREDMRKEAIAPINDIRDIDGTTAVFHDIFTNGIGYMRFVFKTDGVPVQYWPYVGFLKSCIGLMDTKNYTYGDLFNEMNLKTGGIAPLNNVYTDYNDPSKNMISFELKGKALEANIADAVALMKEMLLETKFEDEERLFELVEETLSHVQGSMMSSGHLLAVTQATASFSAVDATTFAMNGVPFLRLLEQFEGNFEECKEDIVKKLRELTHIIFRPENLLVDFIGSETGYKTFAELVPEFKAGLYTDEIKQAGGMVEPVAESIALTSAAQVQFVARCGDFTKAGLVYDGALRAMKVMLEYNYLWTQVRVRGGAYGCMAAFNHSGKSYFVSYRDPNLENTVEVFEKAAEYVRSFEADERTMTQFIIGALSNMDTPMTPATKGLYGLKMYLTGATFEDVQKERDELLGATPDKIRSLSKYIDAFMDTNAFCVVGGEEKIKNCTCEFDKVESLFS